MKLKAPHDIPSADPVTLTVALALMRHPAVGRNRLYAALKRGALHGVRVGRRTAIHIQDLDEWVAAGCPMGNEAASADE